MAAISASVGGGEGSLEPADTASSGALGWGTAGAPLHLLPFGLIPDECKFQTPYGNRGHLFPLKMREPAPHTSLTSHPSLLS